ncbi:hypothetical protein AQPE_1201 [Aquipluma nitroreducens]|uniref:Uncharacterized protein n=1 Tax=Aquipluma nitroreducens TaxID=2010828 RepID=A0A5K7S686_9BACT|nr:hypothetical protein AQPE_1201 [Aquipluma nitroreducens]
MIENVRNYSCFPMEIRSEKISLQIEKFKIKVCKPGSSAK